jgi:cysteine-rich repeat protein
MRRTTRLTSFGVALLVAGCAGSEGVLDDDLDAKAARRCASKQLTEGEIAQAAEKAERLAPEATLEERQPGSIRIRVYAHVITDGSVATASGMLTREQVLEQIDVLNQGFSGTGPGGHNSAYRFFIEDPELDIDYTNNRSWYLVLPGTAAEREMKRALRRGGRDDLNLYFASPGQGLLGWATFPWTLDEEPRGENLLMDGVVVLNESRPGGSAEPYNEGDTAVHEVGHWLGLLHTFQGECDGQDGFTKLGDYIMDTPREVGPTFGCPAPGELDTCPSTPRRPDPVENFMDYTDDACMFKFTRGQALRMNQKFKAFRENKDEEPPACGNGTLDPGEACDTGISSGSGACPKTPADCNDGESCTTDEVIGTGCQAQCFNGEITETHDGDGCCPAGGNAGNDSDCAATCGDGVVSAGETCDTGIASGPGACPTSCSDGEVCTRDVLLGGGTCQAKCVYDEITAPADGDDCCPDGANANTDDDCDPVCGNGVEEAGETCDDGGTSPGDGCSASCQDEPRPPSAFRIREMFLRDPHIYVRLGVCQDLTNGDVGSLSVNGQLNAQLQRDGNGDGFFDMSPVLLFRPLAQTEPTSGGDFLLGRCAVAAGGACSPGEGEVYEGTANNQATGTCVSIVPGSLTDAYSPEVDTPVNQCFATAPQTLPIEIQGTSITLHDATIGAVYENNPATGLMRGLIRGFVTEADAESTIVPLPILGDMTLASLLPGGKDNCWQPSPMTGDKDTGPGGKSGWYFYLNFSAVAAPWAE